MKKILLLISFFAFVFSLNAQEDKTKKPAPLEETQFVFPEYQTVVLKNGLKVFIIEDHEQPTVSFRFLFGGGSSVDGDKSGVADMVADMLTKGTAKKSALDIARTIDDVGASVSASSGNDYITVSANCLTKHMPVLLGVLTDVIVNPSFPKDEFNKLVPQVLAGLKNEKSSPMTVAGRLLRKVMYGENNPYGKKRTEESVKAIELSDLKDYYKKNILPNNASLIVVGDVNPTAIKSKLEKAFAEWKSGDITHIAFPKPEPMPLGIYFVNRPGSVQSTIMVSTPGVALKSDDYESLDLASSIMGAGFAGRLFRTLREKYSYTYTPFGRLGNNKYANVFTCGADVRNQVTDSSIIVIKEQLSLLTSENPSDDELNRIKKFEIGQYQLSFENSDFVASLIQSADFNGLPQERIKNYAQRVMAISPFDIKRTAQRYMNPASAYIIVVGSPEVKSKLEQFGKVYDYDLDLNPLSGEKAKMEKVSLNAKELIEKYVKAIGGQDAVNKIQSLEMNANITLTMQGRTMPGKIVSMWKSPNKKYQSIDLGVFKQQLWTNGTEAWTEQMGTKQKQEGEELDKAIEDGYEFFLTKMLALGYKGEVLGKQGQSILMKVTSPKNVEKTLYFDAQSFLLTKEETFEKTGQGPLPVTINFEKYDNVDGVMMPVVQSQSNPMFEMKMEATYKTNQTFEDKIFQP